MARRSLFKNKLISALNIAGLSIGIAVSLLLTLWVLDEFSFNQSHKGHDRIARVMQNVMKNGEVVTWNSVPYPLSGELRKNYGDDFETIAHTTTLQEELFSVGNKVFTRNGRYAEPDFFKLFSVRLISGSEKQLKGTSGIFLSASMAKAYFGDSDASNKSMTIVSSTSDAMDVSVAGVYEDFPKQSALAGTDYIGPWDMIVSNPGIMGMEDPWRQNFLELYVMMKDMRPFADASAKIKDARLLKSSSEIAKMKPELFLHPMNDWHLYSQFKNGKNAGGRIQYVWLFIAIGGFTLLMACINFMNLTTARSERRSKEVGIRKSIGSARRQLIILFFTESFLTTFISFFVAAVLVIIAMPSFNLLAGKNLTIPWERGNFWIFSFVACCLIALMCAIHPATYLSSISAIKALKGSYRTGKSAAMLRRGLVVVQFTISIVLIVVTITITQQIEFAMERATGYDRARLITVPVRTDAIHTHFDAFSRRLVESRSAVSVSEAGDAPTGRSYITTGISWQGKDPDINSGFSAFWSSKEYGKTVGWKIKQGRDFSQVSLSDTTGIIINEAAMAYMGLKDPIGAELQWWDEKYTIIGVVESVMHESPYGAIQPSVYTMRTDPGLLIIRLNPDAKISTALAKIEATFKEFNSLEPFSYQFVDEAYRKKFETEEHAKRLTTVTSVLTIFISCLGLFGLVAYLADRRTKEIGVRKVLGASVINIWLMLSKDFVLLVMISTVAAVPLGYYVVKSWLENFDYRISFTWFIFVEAVLSVLIITLLTASYQTIVAARRNPVRSLRSE
ncbi:MAG: FtsX-like permease family protein [Chryseolinea sp.]